jgi:hypothetical protein
VQLCRRVRRRLRKPHGRGNHHPFDTGCLPLSYSGNPGVNGVSYRGVNGEVLTWRDCRFHDGALQTVYPGTPYTQTLYPQVHPFRTETVRSPLSCSGDPGVKWRISQGGGYVIKYLDAPVYIYGASSGYIWRISQGGRGNGNRRRTAAGSAGHMEARPGTVRM